MVIEHKLRHRNNRALVDYWLSKAGDHNIPARSDIDLIDVPDLLSNIMLFDHIDTDTLFCRFVGPELVTRFGMEITGQNFLAFLPEANRAEARANYRRITDEPAVCTLDMDIMTTGGAEVAVELVLLPIAAVADRPPAIMTGAWPVASSAVRMDEALSREGEWAHEVSMIPAVELLQARAASRAAARQ